MKISELISGNSFTLTQLNQMLSNPNSTIELKIDFWGSRVLTLDGDTVNLNDVAQRIFAVGDTVFDQNLPLEERSNGVECVRKLRNYYVLTNAEVSKLNWVTYFIFQLKSYFHIGDEQRSYNKLTGFIETAGDKLDLYENFRGFREAHFRTTFPGETQLPDTHFNLDDGMFYFYKGNRMPEASDFRIF